jgi:hypothetical protein
MRHDHDRVYRSFEEFEREELLQMETVGASVDDMIDSLFAQELDFEPGSRGRADLDPDDEE